jgi:hypothetical protein
MKFSSIQLKVNRSLRSLVNRSLRSPVKGSMGYFAFYPLTRKNHRFFRLPFYLFTLFILYILPSCTEEIDLKLRTSDVRLVVEGGISLDTIAHRVILSTTVPYFSSVYDVPYVSDAHVTITELDENMDEKRVFLLTESPTEKGHYYTNSDVYGKQRHYYRLDISNVNISGQKEFTALAHFPPIADKIDSIRVVWGQNLLMLMVLGIAPDTASIRTGWNIEVFAQDPPGANYYAMVVHKNGVPINDTLTRLLLLDNQMIAQSEIGLVGFPMAYISDSSWAAAEEGDVIELEIRAVSQDYYRFIHEFGTVYGGQNPMFGGAPANVRGNVSGGAIGYFWANGGRKASDIADKSKLSTYMWSNFLKLWIPRTFPPSSDEK